MYPSAIVVDGCGPTSGGLVCYGSATKAEAHESVSDWYRVGTMATAAQPKHLLPMEVLMRRLIPGSLHWMRSCPVPFGSP